MSGVDMFTASSARCSVAPTGSLMQTDARGGLPSTQNTDHEISSEHFQGICSNLFEGFHCSTSQQEALDSPNSKHPKLLLLL